jgi:cob(I)alamin adenosyltransferase
MSITTRQGDGGSTDLLGGAVVPKDHPSIECLGVLDELDAFMAEAGCAGGLKDRTRTILETIRKELRETVMYSLAAPMDTPTKFPPDTSADPDEGRLRAWIRELEECSPVRGFALSWTKPAAAKLNIARTVCRRAERRMVSLDRSRNIPGTVLAYMNRLSDLLFMLAWDEEAI